MGGGGGGGSLNATNPITPGEASADLAGAAGQANVDGVWAAPQTQGYGGYGGTVAPQSVYTPGAGVQTGIPQGGMVPGGTVPGYDAELYIPGGYAAPGIASYFAGGGPGGGGGLSYDPGQHDPWLGEVAADTTAGVQNFEQAAAANAAAAEETGLLEAPSGSTLSDAEYTEYANTIGDAVGLDNYNPETDLIPEEFTTADPNDPNYISTGSDAGLAADAINMSLTGNAAGDYHAGHTLAPNIFGTGPSFANPGESGTYGGSLVTGGNDVAGSELSAGINSMINNSIAGQILGTDLPTYATADDMIAAEEEAYQEAVAGGAPAFDMNDPSTWSAPSDDRDDHFNVNNDGDPTNDTGNAGWGFTSFADMFDGGGPGASGDSYTGGIHGSKTVGDTSKGIGSIAGGGNDDRDGGDSGGGGGNDKIVCTAMNHEYGFGSYRNAIWLKYSADNMTKYHEIGYHAIFRPLLRKKWARPLLFHIARHRTADLRAEMQGKKRDTIGRAWRFVLEPICYIVGRVKHALS